MPMEAELSAPTNQSALVGASRKGFEPDSGPVLYGRIPGVGKPVSRIVYGTLFLHNVGDETKTFALLDAVWALGCNAFDCAAIYGGGRCEALLGAWLRSRAIPREQVVLISKGGCHGQDQGWRASFADGSLQDDLEQSLRRLGVGSLDCYMLHRDDPWVAVGEIVEMMHEMQASGQITTWGVSNWSIERLQAARYYAQAQGCAPPVCDSCQVSLTEPTRPPWPNTQYLSAEKRAEWLEATQGEVALLGWECLGKGFLCGRWSRDDGVGLQDIPLTAENSDAWRERQLRIAYCSEDNFDRRDRAAQLAKELGVALPTLSIGYVLSLPRIPTFALVGTTSIGHFREAMDAAHPRAQVAALPPDNMMYLEVGKDV